MSMPNSRFYRERAADTAREAEEARDPRIRERLLRIEKAWLTLAKGAANAEAEKIP